MALLCVSAGSGADWLNVRGDQQGTGYQPDEKILSAANAGKLHRLWTQRLKTTGGLADPIMLGPIVTERGVKELVFVRDAQRVFAVDADLGRIFWTRELDVVQGPPGSCGDVGRASLMMHSSAEEVKAATRGDDEFSDGNRPLYVLTADGRVHVLRPNTGGDLRPAFLLMGAAGQALNLFENSDVLYETSATGCGGTTERIWRRRVGSSGLEIDSKTASFPVGRSQIKTLFTWKGRRIGIAMGATGEPLLKPALASDLPGEESGSGGVATWEDKVGARWICTAAGGNVRKYKVQDRAGIAVAVLAWSIDGLIQSGAPVVANGVVYFLSTPGGAEGRTVLHALDVRDGKELFNSRDEISEQGVPGNLAFANGHVCFTSAQATLTCFGLPFAM